MLQVPIPVALRGRSDDKEQAIKLPNTEEPSNGGLKAPWLPPFWQDQLPPISLLC